jgi:sarcosine oxidase subunit alpha
MGDFELSKCFKNGLKAGKIAANNAGFKKKFQTRIPNTNDIEETPHRILWIIPTNLSIGRRGKHFLDLQNDVTVTDIQLAAREGYSSIEHTKRYTTLGMATDQGKTGNIPGMATLAQAIDAKDPGEVGTTTFRPPYTPVTIGAFAGRNVNQLAAPIRKTPIHFWHEKFTCEWEDVGDWKRPWYYKKNNETKQEALNRECLSARTAIGILDSSTLGKIDIQGPDASVFLDLIYTNSWSKLKIGSCRYGLMLSEDGMVLDDGVTSRLGQNHYLMTTTTGNAAKILEWLEECLQTEWPSLKVYCNSVTEHWASLSICGPKAQSLLYEFNSDLDFSSKKFPAMTVKEGEIAGIQARIFRVSFTGEPTYEINVPANYGLSLWTQLMNAGEKYGITPYGTESMHILRAEKGFIIVGQETDGTVTPIDLGMDWILSKKKDFIGNRSLNRSDTARKDRKHLVGLIAHQKNTVLPEGGQIVDSPNHRIPMPMLGHITSSYYSANLKSSIALALIKNGRQRKGDTIYVNSNGVINSAEITSPCFFDPTGSRLDG